MTQQQNDYAEVVRIGTEGTAEVVQAMLAGLQQDVAQEVRRRAYETVINAPTAEEGEMLYQRFLGQYGVQEWIQQSRLHYRRLVKQQEGQP